MVCRCKGVGLPQEEHCLLRRRGGGLMLVYGFDREKLREVPSDCFNSQLLRVKRKLSVRSQHFEVLVENWGPS